MWDSNPDSVTSKLVQEKKSTESEKMNLSSNVHNQYKTEIKIMFSNLLQEHSNNRCFPRSTIISQKQHFAVSLNPWCSGVFYSNLAEPGFKSRNIEVQSPVLPISMPGLFNPFTLHPQLLLWSLEFISTVPPGCPVDQVLEHLPLKSVSYILRLRISPLASRFRGQTSHLFHSILKVRFLGLATFLLLLSVSSSSYTHMTFISGGCFELFNCWCNNCHGCFSGNSNCKIAQADSVPLLSCARIQNKHREQVRVRESNCQLEL